MVLERRIVIEGQAQSITISDEFQALSDAKASGRAILGIWSQEWEALPCPAGYMIEDVSQLEDGMLEHVVRRHLGLPWRIAETPWIAIREFTVEDAAVISTWNVAKELGTDLGNEEAMRSYIENQYAFYEYGIWAITLQDDKRLIGMAGLSPITLPDGEAGQELGYYIADPFCRKGYAKEACREVMAYALKEHDMKRLYTRIDASNEASIHLAESLGFQFIQINSESGQCLRLYAWNCR